MLFDAYGRRSLTEEEEHLQHFRNPVDLSVHRKRRATHHNGSIICDNTGDHFWNPDNEFFYDKEIEIMEV